jgi:hypothetical protein
MRSLQSLRRLGAWSLSIIETVLVFAGIPAAVIVVIYGAVYAGSSRPSKRYRPGRPFEFTPVWFLAAPEQLSTAAQAGELTGPTRAALPAGRTTDTKTDWPAEDQVAVHTTGGASDRW